MRHLKIKHDIIGLQVKIKHDIIGLQVKQV